MRNGLRTRVSAVLALVGLTGLGVLVTPQDAAPSPATGTDQPVPVFGVESSLVLLDVVVRDRGGRLVRDLRADEFEVYEDGKRQSVAAFDIINTETAPGGARVAGESGANAPAAPEASPAAAAPPSGGQAPGQGEPAVIVFVFDRLSAQGRDRADKAARIYADKGHVPGDLVGVFVIDQALHALLPLSTDLREIRAAFHRAAMQAHTPFSASREKARAATDRAMDLEQGLAALGRASGSAGAGAQVRAQAAALGAALVWANMQARMDRTVDRIERDQQGFSSTDGLLAVVSALKILPGRKTVVFFSEGLTISAHVQPQLESVAAVANRANVSVYAIDAGGLRVESETQEARTELMQHTELRLRSLGRPTEGGGPLLQGLEHSEDMLQLNPHVKLGELAENTGGFLIRDTNDASDGFRRLLEETRFYYLLSYAPDNSEFDGTFRSISVTIKRRGVKVHSRKGYLALQLPRRPAE
jgi:VWFA-related protein